MMKCVASLVALFTLAVVACGCGASASPPTEPTTPASPTLGGISVAGPYEFCGVGICAGVVGNTMQLTATGVFPSGPPQDVSSLAEWQSSDTAVASVNRNGLVSFRGAGDALISATYQTKTAAVTVRLWNTSLPAAQLSLSTRCGGPFHPGEYVALACTATVWNVIHPQDNSFQVGADMRIFGRPADAGFTQCPACGGPPWTFDLDARVPADMTPGVKTFAVWATDPEGHRVDTTASLEIAR